MLSAFFILLLTYSFVSAEPEHFYPKAQTSFTKDPSSFTQGFAYHQSLIYEASGGYGKSYVKKWDHYSQREISRLNLPRHYFAEGLTRCADRWYLTTWKAQEVFEIDNELTSLKSLWRLPYEGWGLSCYKGQLIHTDGSNTLRWLKPQDGSVIKSVTLSESPNIWDKLNESEVIGDFLLINRWYTFEILILDLKTDQLIEVWHLDEITQNLSPQQKSRMDSMNGIAWNHIEKQLLITGKLWPVMYQLQIPTKSALQKALLK